MFFFCGKFANDNILHGGRAELTTTVVLNKLNQAADCKPSQVYLDTGGFIKQNNEILVSSSVFQTSMKRHSCILQAVDRTVWGAVSSLLKCVVWVTWPGRAHLTSLTVFYSPIALTLLETPTQRSFT